jgi:hypothetical protein
LGVVDQISGVSSSITIGKLARFGTGIIDVLEDKTKVPLEVNTDTEINFDEYLKKEENKVIQNNKPNRLIPRKCTINNQVSEIDKRMSLLEIKTNIIKKATFNKFEDCEEELV